MHPSHGIKRGQDRTNRCSDQKAYRRSTSGIHNQYFLADGYTALTSILGVFPKMTTFPVLSNNPKLPVRSQTRYGEFDGGATRMKTSSHW